MNGVTVISDRRWYRGWRVRSLLWGWTCCAMPLIAGVLWMYVLWAWSPIAAVLMGLVLCAEVFVAFAAATQPLVTTGSVWSDVTVDALKKALSVRADVRWREAGQRTSGGWCRQRYGRDLVVVETGVFSRDEALAVVAHELGHTKQSPMAGPLLAAGARITVAGWWLWSMRAAGLETALLTAVVGALAWLCAVLVVRDRVRLALVGAAVLWLSSVDLGVAALLLVSWVVWRVLWAWCDRVHERLADEAVRVLSGGEELLFSALSRLGAGNAPWWRQAFLSHPPTSARGAGGG